MLISIFYVAFLLGIFSTTKYGKVQSSDRYDTKRKPHLEYTMNVSFVFEDGLYKHEVYKDGDYKHADSQYNVKIIRDTVEKINDMFRTLLWREHMKMHIEIEGIHTFKNTGKPLNEYNEIELEKLLKNDAFFRKITAGTDYTQVFALGEPGRDERIAATTFQSICSAKSRGIIIDRQDDDKFHVMKLLAYSLVCAAGLDEKQTCLRVFREKDLIRRQCTPGDNDIRPYYDSPTDCFLRELGLFSPAVYWEKNKKICDRNRPIRRVNFRRRSKFRAQSQEREDDEADEGGKKTMIYILLAVAGVLLILAALLGGWLCMRNREKIKKLKQRVSVKYKYSSMKRDDTPSVIKDPTVTNDLE